MAITLPIHLHSSETMLELEAKALVDTRATRDFIDSEFVKCTGIRTCTLLQPSWVYNVDSTPNDTGLITDIVEAEMTYQDHTEHVYLAVTQLRKSSWATLG